MGLNSDETSQSAIDDATTYVRARFSLLIEPDSLQRSTGANDSGPDFSGSRGICVARAGTGSALEKTSGSIAPIWRILDQMIAARRNLEVESNVHR
jgi:hypothetical protein